MAQKIIICLMLVLLVLLASVGMCIAIDNRVSELEYEMVARFNMQNSELEEMKKKQRITAQDVMILEKRMEERQ